MKRFLRFLQAPVAASIALAALMWAMPSACRAQTPYWTMLGYDAAHTGHNTAETSLYPPFPVDVSYVLGNGIGGISSHGELVFATAQTDTNRLVALDIATGDILWSVPIPESGGGASHTPAVWDTLVYAGGQHGDGLHCINARTGEEVWSHAMGSLFEQHVTVDDGRVYVQARGDRLYCLDGLTGDVVWSRPSVDPINPAIVGDTLYASLETDTLTALHKVSSGILWSVEVPVVRGTLVAGDSLLFVKSSPTEMRALRRSDGSEKWYKEFPGETLGEGDTGCFAYADNRVFVSMWRDGSDLGKVYALEGSSGNLLWDYTFQDTGAWPAVIANGVVYVGAWRETTTYAFDPATGDTIATFSGLGDYYVVSDGRLIAKGVGSTIRILGMEPVGVGDDGPGETPLPRSFALGQNFPNPFNPSTTIRYRLESPRGQVRLAVFDLRGRRIRVLVDRTEDAGEHGVRWDGRDDAGRPMASGSYIYRLEVTAEDAGGAVTASRRMILLK